MPDDRGRRPQLSRRTFVAGALGLFGVRYLVACGGGDEATAAWPQPPLRASRDGRLTTSLRVASGPVRMGGSDVVATTYESLYPGPTIEVRPGELLGVDLVNNIDQATNLHVHGLHVSPQAPADDVLLSVEPGTTFSYAYQLPADHPAGTFWYHAHHHTLADTQVFGGLFGVLVVRGELDELPGVAGRTERVLAISQTQIVDGAVADGDSSPMAEQITLVNGQFQPTMEIAPGEVQRWRVLNASSTFMRLQLAGHAAHVIAVDGNALAATVAQDTIEIAPGSRYDVLIEGGPAGDYLLQSLSQDDDGVFFTSMVPMPQPLMTLRSRGDQVTGPPLPTDLLAFESLRDVAIDKRREFVLEEREPRGVGPNDHFSYYINGKQFDHHRVDETMQLGATEEWHFRNLTYEPHPIHIHVNPFQVVERNGVAVDEQHLRDTATVKAFETLTIRHRFLDYTGQYVMHCHILFHEDHGMMQLLEVVDPAAPSG